MVNTYFVLLVGLFINFLKLLPGSRRRDNMKTIRAKEMSFDPECHCEDCHDTGWTGDICPGIAGNREYVLCDCNTQARLIRIALRRKINANRNRLSR